MADTQAAQTIAGLQQARAMVFTQPETFAQVLQAVCAMAQSTTFLSVQQWCSQFLIDVFSAEFTSVTWVSKQDQTVLAVTTLLKLSDVKDVMVYKNVVLAFSAVYDMVFDLVAKVSNRDLWTATSTLKSKVIANLRGTFPLTAVDNDLDYFRSMGAKIATVKFIGRVITIQSASPQSLDRRRRGGTNAEVSVGNLPLNHQVLNRSQLESEAQKLLDSLIALLNEDYLVPQMMMVSIENLVYIIQRRKQFIPNVLNALSAVDFDAKFRHSKHSVVKFKFMRRYTERALKNALNYCFKAGFITPTSPQNPQFQKIVSTIDTKMNEQKKKGVLTLLPGEKDTNKTKVDPRVTFQRDELTVENNSFKSLYQLIDDANAIAQFDATVIPAQTLANIAIATISNTDSDKLITALSIVSARYTDLITKSGGTIPQSATVKEEEVKEEEDNKEILEAEDDFNMDTTFVFPDPKAMNESEKKNHLQLIIKNFFKLSQLKSDDKSVNSFNLSNDEVASSVQISKVAINDWGKNSWLVLLTRLATRGLHSENDTLSDDIREAIFQYFLESIHDRIDVVLEWLNEEWYSEFMQNSDSKESEEEVETPVYLKWTEKVLDSMIPFLESTDRKIFIRLLSDLPFLNESLVSRVKSLCIDPQRSTMGFQSLQFLILFRPPVKQTCLNILNDVYETNEDLKDQASALLKKYDPTFKEEPKEESTEETAPVQE